MWCTTIKNKDEDIQDGIGDILVTVIILAEQLGYSPEECLKLAWNEIKESNRKRLLVEHLSNPNSWCYYNVTTLLGLRYIQYKHIYLSLIAEQEEGDDFFFCLLLYTKVWN